MSSSSTNNLLPIALHNNAGVGYLERGESKNALRCFKASLALLRQATTAAEDDMVVDMDFFNTVLTTSPESLALLPVTVPGVQDEAFHVFNQAWLLSTAVLNNSALPSRETLEEASCLILFNLGLASHQLGVVTGEEAALRKAFKLYNLTVQLVGDNPAPANNAFLHVVSNNNMAYLHWRFGSDSSKAFEALHALQPSMATVINDEFCPVDENHLDQIMINFVTAQSGRNIAAAAA
jgi:hypothetical protein